MKLVSENGYYAGGFRVMVDGVPQKVFIKRSRELAEQIAMIEIAREAGSELELDDAPAFKFAPAEHDPERIAKRRGAAPVPSPSPMMKRYYEGGVRKIVAGIPVRLARHSPNHSLAHWAGAAPMDGHAYRVNEFFFELEEKQKARVAEALPLAA